MAEGAEWGTVTVRHPSPAASIGPRGRTPQPFYETLSTPVRLARRDGSAFEPVGDPSGSGGAHALHGGGIWRSLSIQAHPGGPRTGVDAREFAAFLGNPDRLSLLAPLLRDTPLVAARPPGGRAAAQEPEFRRGSPPPDGHRIVMEERERSERRLRAFLADDIATTGERVYRRVRPAVIWGDAVAATLVPDPGRSWGFALPIDAYAEACRARRQRRPSPAEAARAARLGDLGRDEEGLLAESVNLFARAACRFLDDLGLDRASDPAAKARIRGRLLAGGGGWRARSWIGGVDVAEGEALLRAAGEAAGDIAALTPDPRRGPGGFGPMAARAVALLLPRLLRGRPPTDLDLEALSAL